MTQKQKIIAGVVGFLFLVLAIVGLYFAFIKPTPKPTPRATPKPTPKATPKPTNTLTTSTTPSADTPSDATPSPATPSPATPSPAIDSEFVIINGIRTSNREPVDFRVNNSPSIRSKDNLITKGCWSFASQFPGRGFEDVFITDITLPKDLRAEAFGKVYDTSVGETSDCNLLWLGDIEPGETKKFTQNSIKVLKFTTADPNAEPLDRVIIKAATLDPFGRAETEFEISTQNKDKLIKKGCWNFAKTHQMYITSVVLPSDIRADAFGGAEPSSFKTGSCPLNLLANVKPGETRNFNLNMFFPSPGNLLLFKEKEMIEKSKNVGALKFYKPDEFDV